VSRVVWIALLCAFGYVVAFFPGLMTEDSHAVYAQARAHFYTDGHPPLMGLLWHYLNFIYPGPALMFLLNMALLWMGIYVLMTRIVPKGWLSYVCLALPFSPHVLASAGFIWKDITFTFGFGLLALVVISHYLRGTRLSRGGLVLFFALLFYCSAVKYQGRFVLPVMLCALMHVQYGGNFTVKSLLRVVCVSAVVIFGIDGVNHVLVTQRGAGTQHFWQCVKVYDLAGISVREKKHLVPSFLKRWPDQTPDDLKKVYCLTYDYLTNFDYSPLRLTQSDAERVALMSAWRSAVWRYPLSYLKHRLYVWSSPLTSEAVGYSWFMRTFGHNAFAATYIAPLFDLLHLMWFLGMCLLFYPTLGRWALRRPAYAPYGRALFFLSSMACVLTGCLFIFSLAGVVRYHYFSIYMLTLAMPLALHLAAAWFKTRRAQGQIALKDVPEAS
jgi:hypothetical protein